METIILCEMLTYGIAGALAAFFVLSVIAGLTFGHPLPFVRKRHW